jgi:CheY-like chemotaxis protein
MGRRILIVDDNKDVADGLSELLVALGHDVRSVPDGRSALEIVKTFHPDFCLVDIGLPEMDGYELAGRLRASRLLPEGARLIAVSGYGRDTDLQRSQEAGFDAHLVKPIDMDLLAAQLER